MNDKMLLEKIEASLIPKASIAKELGVSRQAFYKKLNGDREFKASEVKKLAAILHLTTEEKDAIFFADYVDKMPTRQNA